MYFTIYYVTAGFPPHLVLLPPQKSPILTVTKLIRCLDFAMPVGKSLLRIAGSSCRRRIVPTKVPQQALLSVLVKIICLAGIPKSFGNDQASSHLHPGSTAFEQWSFARYLVFVQHPLPMAWSMVKRIHQAGPKWHRIMYHGHRQTSRP